VPSVSISYNMLSFFHGGNTGSNPVGDAKSFQKFKSAGSFFAGTAWMKSFVVASVRFPWTTNIRAPTFRNLLVAAITSDLGIFMSK
jgi:hypothetical protein